MTKKPIPPRILAVLVAVAAVLTVALTILLLAGHLFGRMGDEGGRAVMDSIAIGIGLFWIIDLVCLLFALGINSLGDDS